MYTGNSLINVENKDRIGDSVVILYLPCFPYYALFLFFLSSDFDHSHIFYVLLRGLFFLRIFFISLRQKRKV